MTASSRSLFGTLEAAAMTRSLPEQEVLKYLSHGHPAVGAEGFVMTNNRYFALCMGCVIVRQFCISEVVHVRGPHLLLTQLMLISCLGCLWFCTCLLCFTLSVALLMY